MADVLSQSQIDMLLSSMRGGDAETDKKEVKEEKKYKSYDFYSPKKFTKDKLKDYRITVERGFAYEL